MSEPKLISPMLDNFDMGGPISDHNGVRCCPAMRKNSDDKYIVKIISVPESQTKLDALLLTGAFSDTQSALSYFEELANGIVDEKKILDNLAQLEGFISFDDCQIVPMDDAIGYDVYLLSEYNRTLERQNVKAPMTQLEAVNLGLDLCSALSACRRSGYLFVDLKPSNIYIVGDKEYRIGDLGFVRLNSLKYESLPDKYRSCYTAPELEDVFAQLNDTIDIYSVGLILYQVFNGGVLPFAGNQAPNQKFDAPAFADAEMAEIILKACDPDPAQRWQDPVQMGQAIVSYMQKNGVNDTPLTSENFGEEEAPEVPAEETEITADSPTADESENKGDLGEETAAVGTDPVMAEEVSLVVDDVIVEDEPAVEICDVPVEEIAAASQEEELDKIPTEEPQAPEATESSATEDLPESNAALQSDESEAEDNVAADEYENLSFLDNLDETEAILADVGDGYDGLSDEVSDILGQIDELTSHDVPAPVVAPDPIEIKIPDPIVNEDEDVDVTLNVEKLTAAEAEEVDESADESENVDEAVPEVVPEEEMPYVPKKKRTGLVWLIVIALLLAIAAGGYYFYTSYYLQPIHALTLEGSEDTLQVMINADIDEALLTVVCADSHGNKVTAPVVGGKAAFSGLTADTAYTVSVEIDGFHQLTGTTTKVYSTPVQTKIAQLNVITGSESGSVILSFAVEGPDSKQWNIIYNAEGEAERVTTFSDHIVTLTGLTVGKEYTFRLEPVEDLYISGKAETVYTARNLVCAENLRVTSFVDGELIAQWDVPTNDSVAQWSVRCYNEAGYNETVTTEVNSISFQNLDESLAYTIEVTAAEMSVNQRISVPANIVTIRDFAVSGTDTLSISWSANRDIPANGWIIQYSVNGLRTTEPVITMENSVQIPAVPNGTYNFEISDSTGNAVLGGPFNYTHSDAPDFNAYSVSKNEVTARLCKTPDESDWNYQDLSDEDYVNTFTAGEKISIVFACDAEAEESADSIQIAYTVYNEDNVLVSYAHGAETWDNLWSENYCELDIPTVPVDAGTYSVIVYFNGAEVGSQKFEITL